MTGIVKMDHTLFSVVQHCITYCTLFASTLQLRCAVCAHRAYMLMQVVVARLPIGGAPCLQIRVGRFDSGPRLHHFSLEINKIAPQGAFCCVRFWDLYPLRHLGSMSMRPVIAIGHHPTLLGKSKWRRQNDIQ